MHDLDSLLVAFEHQNITIPALERALELPSGTIEKWRDTTPPEGLALLRLVRTFPWLLQVAEYKYNTGVAKYLLLERAARLVVGDTTGIKETPTSAIAHESDTSP